MDGCCAAAGDLIRPGTPPDDGGRRARANAFVRVWRGLDPRAPSLHGDGEPATLVLLGDDYDGGHKAWVRWPDGSDDIVPGSQVQREPGLASVEARCPRTAGSIAGLSLKTLLIAAASSASRPRSSSR